jgi:1-acyl-sn-glycerol-3-phosphate acyltransferase
MITLKDIEKHVLPSNSADHMRHRHPQFWQRYEGQSDKFDFNLDFLGQAEGVFRFFFERYFRVQVRGVQNIPDDGAVILAGNHSGTLPIDALMTFQASLQHHSPRRIRYLVLPWFKKIEPIWNTLTRLGAVEASFSTALTLLEENEIVGIYPEAEHAMTKTWSQRYQLRDFNPGFVKLAIATQTPIVPVVCIGAEESYPNFGNWKAMAKFMDMPLFPITLTFPWLPVPFAFTPMPSRWLIQFGKPITLNYSRDKSFDEELVKRITAEIRHQIQEELKALLAKRRSIVSGWDERDLDLHELRAAMKELSAAMESSAR